MVTPQVFLVLCKKIYRYIIRISKTCIFHEDATTPSLLTAHIITSLEILLTNNGMNVFFYFYRSAQLREFCRSSYIYIAVSCENR